jgi:HPt (histidine-containing phosphotransfer) domain-containing protein
MPPERGAVDLRDLFEACGTGEHDNAELLREILGHVVRQNRERLMLAQAALADPNRLELAQLAHAVKGSAALVGARQLAEIARGLEHDAGTAPAAALQQAVTAMTAEFQAVIETLRRMHPDLVD